MFTFKCLTIPQKEFVLKKWNLWKKKSEGDIGAKGKWETIQWTFLISGKIFSFLDTILV
jgi:hypothetical protein